MRKPATSLRVLAPAVLVVMLPAPLPEARSQAVAPTADPLARQELLDDAYRDLDASRSRYLDALDRVEAAERHRALRPPFATPYNAGGRDPIAEAEALRARPYLEGPRPYVLRPVPPYGPPLGHGAPGYDPIAPLGYGIGPRGGIDIPFGFGLGGMTIRW